MARTILRCVIALGCIFAVALITFGALTIFVEEQEDETRVIAHDQRVEALFAAQAVPPGRPPVLEGDPAEHDAVPTPGAAAADDDMESALDDDGGAPGAAGSTRAPDAAESDPDDVDALLADMEASRRGDTPAADDDREDEDAPAIRSAEEAEAAAREAREAEEREAREDEERAAREAREAEARAAREAEARAARAAEERAAGEQRTARAETAPAERELTPREREARAAAQQPETLRPAVRDDPPSAGAVQRWWPRQPGPSGFGLNHAGSLGGEQAIVLLFNAPVHSDSVGEHVRVRDLQGNPVSGNWRVPSDNPRAAVLDVPESGRYTVMIDGQLEDRSGRALGANMHGPVFVR